MIEKSMRNLRISYEMTVVGLTTDARTQRMDTTLDVVTLEAKTAMEAAVKAANLIGERRDDGWMHVATFLGNVSPIVTLRTQPDREHSVEGDEDES